MYFLQRLSFLNKRGNGNFAARLPDSNHLKWIVMRLELIMLVVFAACFQVSGSSFGQIRIKADHKALKKVLEDVENQSGMIFMYNNTLLENSRPVNLDIQSAPLELTLKRIFDNQPFSYQIIDKTIILKVKPTSSVKETMEVEGRINDETGKPFPGVVIQVQGSEQKTISDKSGYFKLTKVDRLAVLICSFVGYERQYVKVAEISKDRFIITMKPTSTTLNEVVMVGYGAVKRKDLTGSVSSVNINEINNSPLVTIDQALAGKAPGVQVTQSDGSPGGVARIRIRGGTSLLGGNDPLYIIDGVQVNVSNNYIGAGGEVSNPVAGLGSGRDAGVNNTIGSSFGRGLNTLAGLNLNDIESIDILKDASATAIYGSRAANGVVIITTKKGKKNEKPLLEANYYYAVSTAIREKVLNAEEYKKVFLKGSQNLNNRLREKGLPLDAAASAYLTNPDLLGTANTNWLDMVTRTGQTQNADLSLRGGGTASSYYMSLSYNKQLGTLEGTSFSRIAGKINLTNELSDKLRVIANLDLGFTKNSITNGVYSAAVLAPPTWSPYNADGTLSVFPNAVFPGTNATSSGITNPMALLQGKNLSDGNLLLGSLALEYDILKELKFRSTASVNYSGSHQLTYEPSTVSVINNNLGGVPGDTGIGSQAQSQNNDFFFENTLTWDKQLNIDNHLTILAGTSWQKTKSRQFAASGQTYPDDVYLNGLSSAAVYLRPTAGESYAGLLSFYMRANYSLKDRYLLTITARSDASSKFPATNRVGYFPSAGIAWKIKEESFLKDVSWLDELKLRASAGYTGTQNIGNNLFYTLYTPVAYAGANALVPSQLGNDKIKWENTLQKDVGLDIAVLNGRLSASIGYYHKYTKGLLMSSAVPLSSGFSSALINKADISNKGLEIELRGDLIKAKNFGWNMAINVSANRSKVEKLNRLLPSATSLGSDDPAIVGEMIGNNALVPGGSIGQFYGAYYLGVLRNQQDINLYTYPSSPVGSVYTLFPPISNTLGLGSPYYQTYGMVYGENALAPMLLNRTAIGDATPKFYGGMTHMINYKRFSVIANLTYSYGGKVLYLYENNSLGLGDLRNKSARIQLPTYQDDPNSNRPILYLKDPNTPSGAGASTLNIFDASYIKLKSINISYALPQALLQKLGVRQALIYISASNLFTITKYPGPDPEVSNDPYSIIGGNTDDASYPQARQYAIGARFSF